VACPCHPELAFWVGKIAAKIGLVVPALTSEKNYDSFYSVFVWQFS
jgi:hypothetical protein